MLGRLLDGKYQVTRLLGEGGMGAVYEAQNIAIQRRVAIKTIHRHRMDDPSMMARFRREAFAMAAVESEHVVTIFDAGEDDQTGVAFLVMEFLSGEDLGQVLTRVGPLPAETALRIVHQALQGLRAAHLANLMHRDIKPSNIFLVRRPDGARLVKLVDFGIARSLSDAEPVAAQKVTKTGIVVGSPPYMSPEQLASSPALDGRTDLWSLGVVLFEMLAGANPYASAADLPQLLARICLVPPPLVRDVAPWVPGDAATIVGRAMQQNPAERYSSAAAMLADVGGLLSGSYQVTEAMLVTAPRQPSCVAQVATMPVLPVATSPAVPLPAIGTMPPGGLKPSGGMGQAALQGAAGPVVSSASTPATVVIPTIEAGPVQRRASGAGMVAGVVLAGVVAGAVAASYVLLRGVGIDEGTPQSVAGTAGSTASSAPVSTRESFGSTEESPGSAVSSASAATAEIPRIAVTTGSTPTASVPTGSTPTRANAVTPAGAASARMPGTKGKTGSAFGNSRGGD